ncbi:hypothetical protein [Microbulbifer sp. JTAC008]|uniref:hypothetical protein n=1 Tax=unclassified Microbulbifer TaxID=2619833 RepID=UPI00403A068B
MDTEKYLALINSYVMDNFRSVCKRVRALRRVGGFVATHIAPVSIYSQERLLVRESSFFDVKQLSSLLFKEGKVASEIYICPLAVRGDALIMQVDVNQWTPVAELPSDAQIIKSHGLPLQKYSAPTGNSVYVGLPLCEVIPDDQKLFVEPLELKSKTKQERIRRVEVSLRQVLEGFEVDDTFKKSLVKALKEQSDHNVVLGLIQMVSSIKLEGVGKYLSDYLFDSSSEIRLAAFIAITNVEGECVDLKSQLLRCLVGEENMNARALMFKNLIKKGILTKEWLADIVLSVDLSRREERMLNRMKIER